MAAHSRVCTSIRETIWLGKIICIPSSPSSSSLPHKALQAPQCTACSHSDLSSQHPGHQCQLIFSCAPPAPLPERSQAQGCRSQFQSPNPGAQPASSQIGNLSKEMVSFKNSLHAKRSTPNFERNARSSAWISATSCASLVELFQALSSHCPQNGKYSDAYVGESQ